MLFKCAKGMFLVQRNHREAFNLESFIEKYIEECFDKSAYIVGDISSTILRLKGFDLDPKSPSYFGNIDNYLEVSCAFGCPYYVLKRIKTEEEYSKLEKNQKNNQTNESKITITPIVKENFDKESLVLKTSPKSKPSIVIDSKRINAIPKGELPKDLVEFISQQESTSPVPVLKQEEPVETQTYVSASPDFDPSKKESFRKNKNKNNNSSNSNNNNQNKKHKNKKNFDGGKK